jgi:hypothetical protein
MGELAVSSSLPRMARSAGSLNRSCATHSTVRPSRMHRPVVSDLDCETLVVSHPNLPDFSSIKFRPRISCAFRVYVDDLELPGLAVACLRELHPSGNTRKLRHSGSAVVVATVSSSK